MSCVETSKLQINHARRDSKLFSSHIRFIISGKLQPWRRVQCRINVDIIIFIIMVHYTATHNYQISRLTHTPIFRIDQLQITVWNLKRNRSEFISCTCVLMVNMSRLNAFLNLQRTQLVLCKELLAACQVPPTCDCSRENWLLNYKVVENVVANKWLSLVLIGIPPLINF